MSDKSSVYNALVEGIYFLDKILDYRSTDMFNFHFSEKTLGLVSPPHFGHDFSRKMFLMLYCINWENFIAWLPSLLEILDNMCIKVVCKPGCDVMQFQINLIFLIKPFRYMTKKSRQKLKYLENEMSFWVEIKKHFSSFLKGFQLPKVVSDLTVRL